MNKRLSLLSVLIFICFHLAAQPSAIKWSTTSDSYLKIDQGELVETLLPSNEKKIIVSKQQLTPSSETKPLSISSYSFSNDQNQVLIFTNTKRVWRINSKGDYWVFNKKNNSLKKLGASLPASSLMFGKLSPDGTKAAYVSNYNIYTEDLATGVITPLTKDGTRKYIYGTFDWVYEEEFFCRDGIRWSPDSKSLAFWQIDASNTQDFYMINTTDSIYSQIVPVEYPKVGESPSSCRVGTIDVASGKISYMNIAGDPRQHYIVRMEYIPGTQDVLIQQLNRKQNESKLIRVNTSTGTPTVIYTEKDNAWVDIFTSGNPYAVDFTHTFDWTMGGKEFIWSSEKDGWQQLYRVSIDGKQEQLITPGNYDVMTLNNIDEKSGLIYFMASPENATQKYLYKSRLDGKGKLERVSPANQPGTHSYSISVTGKYAQHSFSNSFTRLSTEFISLPAHVALDEKESINSKIISSQVEKNVEFFKITTEDGVEMDGWMVKPSNFDASKKYPVVFYVYTEPAGANVIDRFGVGRNRLYKGNMQDDGYVYISLDNRGTPAPKGSAWRKSIYRKIGIVNIRDQAMAAKKILEWTFVDPERIAVWGWSGGGSATLNLLFQYPEIYKTGIAIAAVANQLTYDNIYQERYMGIPQENREDFEKGSPIYYAKNLKGNLLYIHGTGDDNVHYQNAEMLVNELIKHNKQFQFMPYPNRTHGISEGEGTSEHLSTLFTEYLKKHCPPGGKQTLSIMER